MCLLILLQKLIKVVAVNSGDCGYLLYVLAGHTLQKWLIVFGEIERLVYEVDVNRLAIDAFQKTIWVGHLSPCYLLIKEQSLSQIRYMHVICWTGAVWW